MTDAADHAARLDSLEVRIAYQDQVIEDLNTALTRQWKELDRMSRELARLGERVQQAEDTGFDAAPEPPPPHY
jgi:SlyX protein